jgi:hypothetical protein
MTQKASSIFLALSNHLKMIRFSSWPGIAVRRTASLPLAFARPSTPFLLNCSKDVDARHKAGHDDA